MIFDVAYKLARKAMGSGLYNAVSYNLLGRRANYERISTYEAIYRHYLGHGIEFRGRTVLEAGSGLQYFTALFFLSAGAERVHLVEPKLDFDPEALRRTVEAFNRATGSGLGLEEARSRICCHRDLSAIPADLDASVDLIVSYTVLEHVGDLPGFFAQSARLLKPGARAYHLVDLSDHTYQVFARWPLTAPLNANRALYHLRYSRSAFRLLNDPKCWMNRALLPEYLDAVARSGLRVEGLEKHVYGGPVRVHPELCAAAGGASEEDLRVQSFSLDLEKPAGKRAASQ